MSLICKNCGGTISLNNDSTILACEFCGAQQTVSTALSCESDSIIFINDDTAQNSLFIYKAALSIMNSAKTEKNFLEAAEKFEQISYFFNADILATECLNKAKQQRIQNDEIKRKNDAQRAIITKTFSYATLIVAVLVIIVNLYIYSLSNIKIHLSPDEENFVSERYNDYIFTYNVKIENKGLLDINSIEGSVIFEKDNEILVDTPISFYNYSSAVVRAHKNTSFKWELTIYSYDTALILYETDFDDIKVKIDISSITYENGKTKTY